MNILLVSSVFPPATGGSGRYMWEVYRRLPLEQVVVATCQHARQSEFDQQHQVRIERVYVAPPTWGFASIVGLRSYLGNYRSLRRVVQENAIDEVHCGTLLPEGWLGWMLHRTLGLPFLCFVHGEELNVGASSRELSWMMRRVLRTAGLVIANSENTKRLLQRNWIAPSSPISVLNPGIDVDRFKPAASSADVRHTLGWGDRTVLLTAGRLQKRKGHDTLIRALPAIRRKVPDVLYAIVGDGAERRNLESLVGELGLDHFVRFHGEPCDEELIRCYQQCDLFVLPNREVDGDIEGFGMVLVEAQACGKPVIAGRSGGTSETMQVPHTGRIVSCDGPNELVDEISTLLLNRSQCEKMGQAGTKWATERFGWDSLVEQAKAIFSTQPHRNRLLQAAS